ncbi:MAG: response regulator [Desulfobacteraceae bacterium]|nr:response regulator [Desulfobacteraceae bacterium]
MTKYPILVVDDEKNIRLTVGRVLESLEIPVHTAVNGEAALQKLQEDRFSMVFLDLKMPGMDGMEVLRRIKANWPQTRVVIITAHGTIESAVKAMKLGAVDFLQKPFSPAEILELAKEILHRETMDADSASDYRSLVTLGKRYISDRHFEAAQQTVRKAIAVDPGRPEAYNLLGALLELQDNRQEAQKFYRMATDIDPSFKSAWANLERSASWNKFGGIDLGADHKEDESRDENENEE